MTNKVSVSVSNSHFYQAHASLYGAAVYNSLGSLSMTNSYIDESSMTSSSGVVFNSGGTNDFFSSCGAGAYGSCRLMSEDDDMYSCKLDACFGCPPGRFGTTGGLTVKSQCTPCADGTYTGSNGSTSCATCRAGSYVGRASDANNEDGVGVTSGGTHCVLCPQAKFGATEGQSSCADCSDCTDCVGTTARRGSTNCSLCEQVRVS